MRTLVALAILLLAPILTVVILFLGTLASDEAVEKKMVDSRESSVQVLSDKNPAEPENR